MIGSIIGAAVQAGQQQNQQFQQGLGGIGGFFAAQEATRGFGQEQDLLEQAQRLMAQQEKQGIGELQPFQQAGVSAIPQVQRDVGLLQDPLAARQFLLRGFQTSPEAKLTLEAGTRAATQAGAASGMLGSGAQRAALQGFGQRVQSADIDKFLAQQHGLFTQGLAGEMGQERTGLQAGQSIGQLIAQLASAQAQAIGAQGQAAAQKGQSRAAGLGSLIGGVTKFL